MPPGNGAARTQPHSPTPLSRVQDRVVPCARFEPSFPYGESNRKGRNAMPAGGHPLCQCPGGVAPAALRDLVAPVATRPVLLASLPEPQLSVKPQVCGPGPRPPPPFPMCLSIPRFPALWPGARAYGDLRVGGSSGEQMLPRGALWGGHAWSMRSHRGWESRNFPYQMLSSRLCLELGFKTGRGSRNSVWVTWRQHPTVSLPLRKTIPDMI